MTPEREAMLESAPPEVASEREWAIYRQRNDSLIVDLFQGQYRNRLECLTCHKVSVTCAKFITETTDGYWARHRRLMMRSCTCLCLSHPVKQRWSYKNLLTNSSRRKWWKRRTPGTLYFSLATISVLGWHHFRYCPRCKTNRRASKTLTIARLPPVLLIQLKRFTTRDGLFWDKSETPVIFPIRGLDLTRYLPGPAGSSVGSGRQVGPDGTFDPRTQVGPFKYDLYGVSNHMGTLSSGHCESSSFFCFFLSFFSFFLSFFLLRLCGLARRQMTNSEFRYGFREE